MHDGGHDRGRRLLDEAAGPEAHADALATLAACRPMDVHVPILWVLARGQRIRAMELRGAAAALFHRQGRAGRFIEG